MKLRNIIVYFLFCFYFCIVESSPCVYQIPPNKFDLSNLTRTISPDWNIDNIIINSEKTNIVFNFCASTIETPISPCSKGIPAFAVINENTCVSFGSLTSGNMQFSLIDNNYLKAGVNLKYGKDPTSLTIRINCKSSDSGDISSLTSINNCSRCYLIEFMSKYGCPMAGDSTSDEGISFSIVGWIILICIIVCVVMYLGIGVIINWKIRKIKPGLQLIPHWGLWKALAFYIFVFPCKKILRLEGKSDSTSKLQPLIKAPQL